MLHNIIKIFFIFILTFILFEFLLKIYNPLEAVITKGEKIILRANSYTVSKHTNSKLPEKITYSTNSLGIRGPEIKKSF